MNRIFKQGMAALLALVLCLAMASGAAAPAEAASYVYNWGTRGEVATELSTAASDFYSGSNTYENFSQLSGSTSTGSVPSSELYKALQTFMVQKHTKQTSYQETRYMYCYTDCENGGGKISSFYSGKAIGPSWDSGSTWNREHTWPNSKGLGGNDENDIMMLRPTSVSENSSRGNTAYGESSGYYHPNSASNGKYDLRGDVARIMLYVYVRWGNTGKMWGSSGVMESVSVLLKWMEADPVDTWELGRNDSVQSITGTRNVFVDYPELAFILFGQEVPENMSTPSQLGDGGSSAGGDTSGDNTSGGNNSGNDTPDSSGDNVTDTPDTPACTHANTERKGQVAASCSQDGYTGDLCCADCGERLEDGERIPAAHTLKRIAAVAPTLEADGTCEHYKCQICRRLFKDAEGQEQASLDYIRVERLKVDEEADNNLKIVLIVVLAVVLVGGGATVAVILVKQKKAQPAAPAE